MFTQHVHAANNVTISSANSVEAHDLNSVGSCSSSKSMQEHGSNTISKKIASSNPTSHITHSFYGCIHVAWYKKVLISSLDKKCNYKNLLPHEEVWVVDSNLQRISQTTGLLSPWDLVCVQGTNQMLFPCVKPMKSLVYQDNAHASHRLALKTLQFIHDELVSDTLHTVKHSHSLNLPCLLPE